MKTSLVTLLLSFVSITVFSQDFSKGLTQELRYEVRAKYVRPVKKTTFSSAKLISDIIPGYPANWVTSYLSVEISAVCNGKTMNAVSSNSVLSAEQINILNSVDLATDIVINVKYKYKDPLTSAFENNKIHVSMTVIPETEAEFTGGYANMIKHLKENGLNTLSKKDSKNGVRAKALFTVNEKGQIENAKMLVPSGDTKTDKILLDAINKMPVWKPAQNSKGIKVKQEFVLTVGNNDGC